MTKKSFPPAAFSHQGVDFRMCYTYPAADKHKDMPCRGRINPLDPMTGKCLTKRQLYGKDSDAPVNHIVHGKDPWDVYSKREAAANYLISVMVQRGLLSGVAVSVPDEDADLAELARNYKQTLYDIMVDELAGLRAGDLDDAAYKQLQEKICRNAARDATKHNTWEYGEIPPSSARTRLFLLYELIRCLKAEGVSIPVAPFPYNGKPSRQMLLLNRTDHARMIPDAILRAICADPVIQGQAEILADAGLRIGECTGLLFDSLRWLDTSQGRMYYLDFPGNWGRFLHTVGTRWKRSMATSLCALCAASPARTSLTTAPPKQPPGNHRCAHKSQRCCASPLPSRRLLPIAFIFSTNEPRTLSCTPSLSPIPCGAISVQGRTAPAG